MNFQQYNGLVVPTITPFTSDEKIDEKSLRNIKNLVQEQINKVDDKIKNNIIE